MYSPRVTSVEYGQYHLNGAELESSIKSVNPDTLGVHWEPKKTVSIVPSSATASLDDLNDDQKCLVRWSYSIEMPRWYSDISSFGGVTINPVFELEDKPADLLFWAEPKECSHIPGSNVWSYRRAFIGNQHLRVWWQPKGEAQVPPQV